MVAHTASPNETLPPGSQLSHGRAACGDEGRPGRDPRFQLVRGLELHLHALSNFERSRADERQLY